jgi:hypothetical protein
MYSTAGFYLACPYLQANCVYVCLICRCVTEICIYSTNAIGNEARQPEGDLLKASMDPTCTGEAQLDKITSCSETWDQASRIFVSAPAHIS